MSQPSQTPVNDTTAEEQLARLEKFIARRFDEISMEINATSQMIDMAEEGASTRFHEVLGMLSAITHSGDGNTPANSGAELEAVIEESEQAANRIMDAADRIVSCLEKNKDATVKDITADIDSNVQEILMACSFQDLTSQRVRTSLDKIQMIEERLSNTLSKFGIEVENKQAQTDDLVPSESASQGDIDALFD
jgi:chemotaxis protein CheZ